MTPEEELEYYKKAYSREKKAKKEAERLLEFKALELYEANQELLSLNANLEEDLEARIAETRQTERQYRLLVESANDIIYRTDVDGHFTYVNPTGEHISGYSSEELIGTSFLSLLVENFKKPMIAFYQNQMSKSNDSSYFEYQIETKTGERIWLGQNVQLIIRDGEISGFLAVARNINERVESDNELKRSEEKYKKMFEGAFDGVMHLDEQGNFKEWNSKMEELLGYSAEELSQMHISNIVHPDDREKSAVYLEKLISEGFYTNYTGRIIGKSGKVIDIEVNSTATYDENGNMIGSIDNVRDISERVTIEKAIVQSEEKYRGIIENLELGLLEVDKDERITKVYESFCKLTGYDEADLLGRRASTFLLHPDSIKVLEEQSKLREQGIASVYEVQVRHKNGDYNWAIISGAPFYDEKGNHKGSVGVHLDISDRKRMEEDLQKANQVAVASAKAKELFLANMSHEIRTPLNAVIGLSNLLKKTDLNKEQVSYISNINNSAKSLLLLVNDILDITKIESGKLEVNDTVFNLRKTIGTIFSSTGYLAQQKKLDFDLEIDDKLDENYQGDELKICQVLINLTNNAIKFTNKGKVVLGIYLVEDTPEYQEVEIAVKDTGKGIAPEALETIFEDFSQENSSISKDYGGTGLGLSISRKLVHLLGGDLQVSSEVDKGTTFYFKIKLQRINAAETAENTQSDLEINWLDVKILAAEDNPVNQFVIQSTVESWGGKIDLVENGEEAIKRLEEKQYDVVLMDLQMPIMDGIAATKYIRQELRLDIPIIAFTANAIKTEKERCLTMGMNAYISKPFQEEELKRKMIQLITSEDANHDLIVDESTEKQIEEIFTLDRLQELSRGNDAFILRMLDIFLTDGNKQLNAIENSTDSEVISQIAHKLKPSIDYLSNADFKALVRKIEAKLFVPDPEILVDFKKRLKLLLQEVEAYLKNKHS